MVQMKTIILVAFLIGACRTFPTENVKDDPLVPIAKQAGGTIAEALLSVIKPLLESINKGVNNILRPNRIMDKVDEVETYVMQIPQEPMKSAQEEKPVNEMQRSIEKLEENKVVDQPNKH